MVAIHIDDLRERTDEILRRLQETGETVEIRDDDRTSARLVPIADDAAAREAETAAIWDDLERLSVEIGRRWPAGVSAAAAVRDDRRDL